MTQEFVFTDESKFLHKLQELRQNDVRHDQMTIFTPYPVHGIDEMLDAPASNVKLFTFVGAVSGFIAGLALTIYTTWSWPIIVGGKPYISLPPYILIAYVLVILFGALASFTGFIFFTRLPDIKNIIPEKDYDNQFVILLEKGGE